MNEQEALWSGRFGDEYHARQAPGIAANLAFFARALERVERDPTEILELGCGDGRNLAALGLLTGAKLFGVEINAGAAEKASGVAKVWEGSAVSMPYVLTMHSHSLLLTKGFLIHIAPADLQKVYAKMLACGPRWMLICEYFSPVPREIEYRGQQRTLWARDFGEDVAEHCKARIIDMGFAPKRGKWPQDNLTFWLLER